MRLVSPSARICEPETRVAESTLLQNLSSARNFNARDLADLAFFYMIGLHILRLDFDHADWAKHYAARSLSPNWHSSRSSATDLYQLLHLLLTANQAHWGLRDPAASSTLLGDLELYPRDFNLFLRNIQHQPYDEELSRRLLLKAEKTLRIQNSNYRSVRRIAGDWSSSGVDTEAKSLAVTRLLQALNHRAHRGEIVRPLEQMAAQQRLSLNAVCNPETGKGCTTTSEKTPSLLGQLARTAGLTVGAYLLGKALFSR